MADSTSGRLRLLAEDAEDLAVISAAVQDAVVQVGDITYEPAAHKLTLAFNRFCWDRFCSGGSLRHVTVQVDVCYITGK